MTQLSNPRIQEAQAEGFYEFEAKLDYTQIFEIAWIA